MRKILHLLTLTALLAGCATYNNNEADHFRKYDDIGVLAFFSPNMPIQFNPFSARHKKDITANIASWNLESTLVADIEIQLKDAKKDIKKVTVDPMKVQAGLEEARKLNNVYLGDRYQILDQYLLSEAKDQGADYLFILHPISSETFPQHKGGFGFICNSSKDSKGDLTGYALFRTEIWNVKTKSVDRRVTITPDEMFFKTGKNCQETRNIAPEKLAELYKNEFIELARRSTALVIQKARTPIAQ